MSRRYTAQEIRTSVQKSICEDNIAEMLLQYADELEREKKYEYASVLPDGSMSCAHDDNFEAGYHAFRREVGEWEKVADLGNGNVKSS